MTTTPQPPSVTPATPPTPAAGLPFTDKQRAERFADWLDGDLHYIYLWKQWAYWENGGWNLDPSGTLGLQIKRRAFAFADAMMEEAKGYPAGTAQTSAIGVATSMQSVEVLNRMIAAFTSFEDVAKRPDDFDTDPYMLAVKNGVVDLKTGTFRAMTKDDMMLKKASVDYDPKATCPMWEEFLAQVQATAEVQEYLQRAMGYTLTGITTEQVMFFLHGHGQNGKNTFVDVFSNILGDYTWTSPATLFLETKADDTKMNMQAQLPERRFVVGEEMPEEARLAEARLKDLTGNDRVTGRKLFCESFNFKPTHKLWFFGNYKPMIKGQDEGIWRRLNLIPFTIAIAEDKRDRKILARLLTESSGILNWAIEGCLAWQKQGLAAPEIVKVATEDYREEEDLARQFIEEACVLEPFAKTLKGVLSAAFELWMKDAGYKFSPSPRAFNGRIKRMRGISAGSASGRKLWNGVALKDPTAYRTKL
jgi:putative DNA primase/helicase